MDEVSKWILMFILTIIGILVITVFQAKSHAEEQKEKGYSNLQFCGSFNYLGGFNEITDKIIISIEIVNKEFLLFISHNRQIEIKIPLKDIIDVSTKMEDEVSRDVTLTRLLIFNVFAFGLKKEKHHLQKFLIIRYLDDKQEEKSLIFGGNLHPEKAYKIINENLKLIDDIENNVVQD